MPNDLIKPGQVMLLTRAWPSAGGYTHMPYSGDHQSRDHGQFIEYLRLLRRRFWPIAIIAALGLAAGIVVSLLQPPLYRSRTTLDIQEFDQSVLNMRPTSTQQGGGSGSAESYIQTEMKILQSESTARRAIDRLKSPPEEPTRTDLTVWSRSVGARAVNDAAARRTALENIAKNLKVRTLGLTRIVEVLCDSRNARLAADFCNTLAEEYIAQNSEIRWQTTKQTGEWMSHQLEDLKRRLSHSEEELQHAARASTLLFSENENLAQDKVRALQTELSNAQAERVKRQSLYEMAVSSPPDALSMMDNGPAREYQVKLTDLKRELAELSSTLTPEHYKIQELQSQINVMQNSLERQREAVIAQLHSEYQAAQRRESLLTSDYNSLVGSLSDEAARAVQYNMLKREVDSGRQLYEAMLHRVEELGVASAMRASTIRVVDRASASSVPFSPRWAANCIAGLFAGIVIGVAVALLLSRSDRSLRMPGETANLLNVRELGVIPSAGPQTRVLSTIRQRMRARTPGGSVAALSQVDRRPELAALNQRHYIVSESFSAAMNSILFSGEPGSPPRVMVITSPEAGDGKTTISSNLAISLAGIERKVLLIDGDLRRPNLTKLFHLESRPGLVDFLRGEINLDQLGDTSIGEQLGVPNLHVLPAGSRKGFELKLLHSNRMRELLARSRAEYDIVLLDSPPMAYIGDARVLGRLTDGVLLVFRAGKTTVEIAVAAQRCFTEDNTCVIGTILNGWNARSSAPFRRYAKYDPLITEVA